MWGHPHREPSQRPQRDHPRRCKPPPHLPRWRCRRHPRDPGSWDKWPPLLVEWPSDTPLATDWPACCSGEAAAPRPPLPQLRLQLPSRATNNPSKAEPALGKSSNSWTAPRTRATSRSARASTKRSGSARAPTVSIGKFVPDSLIKNKALMFVYLFSDM